MASGDVVTRRLFFAFDLDEPCREAVQRLVDLLARRVDSQGPGSKRRIKWVERENWHLTLSFLGATPETRLTEIRSVLESPFSSGEFELQFDKLGVFPDRGAPRIVWLGASAGTTEAETVRLELAHRLEAIGVPPEGRPFRAHLTLGRFHEPGHAADGRAVHEFAVDPIGPLLVDHITLYESHLSTRGPSYASLVRVPLRKSEAGIRIR